MTGEAKTSRKPAAKSRPKPSRKFLVIIDDTEECGRALRFAVRRAEHGAGVVLLYVIVPGDFQHWLNVESIMREEGEQKAKATLKLFAKEVASYSKIKPEFVIREGVLAEEIVKLIEEDRAISILMLAAASGTEGPGPLVSNLAGTGSGTFPIPITIIPGNLTDAEIDRLA